MMGEQKTRRDSLWVPNQQCVIVIQHRWEGEPGFPILAASEPLGTIGENTDAWAPPAEV